MPQIQHGMSSAIPLKDGRLMNDKNGVGGHIRNMAMPQTQMMGDGRFVNNAQGVGGHIVNMTPPNVIQHVVPQQFQQLPQQYVQAGQQLLANPQQAIQNQVKKTLERKSGLGKATLDILGDKQSRKVVGKVAKSAFSALSKLGVLFKK